MRLASEYQLAIDHAPNRDFVVHTLEKREANGMPLMSAEIVIASAKTREEFPLAATYPLHFRKTYFAGSLHGDPAIEYECGMRASALIDQPQPIGHTPSTFRSCLIPGQPYRRLTPFLIEPEERNLRCASELSLPTAAGLWRLAEEAYGLLTKLHAGGLAHGDLELQNLVVCPAPLEVVLIDFEAAVFRDAVDERRLVGALCRRQRSHCYARLPSSCRRAWGGSLARSPTLLGPRCRSCFGTRIASVARSSKSRQAVVARRLAVAALKTENQPPARSSRPVSRCVQPFSG